MSTGLRQQYEDAYVEWLDAIASSDCLEERLPADIAFGDATASLIRLGLTKAEIIQVHKEYRDFI